ncbi:AAA family ATPase [Aureimonas pseudogalii]|uniref:Wobble nucleotide-excising tRNase n=1 Tax=Aureimonas pseudogalii TaxID=1744844 RepID=A0A7W6EE25_9HYPH|nr:AAA family ATPase [Aureimonas pseudogalii]MBB3998366.1 wobble nucleotide-excising tRNase [Aureimonas pseudogalii]
MLQEIKVAGHGSYRTEGQVLAPLKAVNFLFGTNGAGKTTISRVIHDPDAHAPSSLTWRSDRPLPCLVYNSDFVARNFAAQMPGIFTLGEAAHDTLERIERQKGVVDGLEADIAQMRGTLGPGDCSSGKRGDRKALRDEFERECWKIKIRHDAHFKESLQGLRNSAAKFCDRVLEEARDNTADAVDVEELRRAAAILFGRAGEPHVSLPLVDLGDLLAVEGEAVLARRVIGKEDVDVAALIRRLGNSDWVRQGLPYLGEGRTCPFCQQAMTADLVDRIEGYFDETYLNEVATISKAHDTYEVLTGSALRHLNDLLALESPHIDADALRGEIGRLGDRLAVNLRLLAKKKREPSAPVVLETIEELARPIAARVAAANDVVAEHNRIVANIAEERRMHTRRVWRCLLNESAEAIRMYTKKFGDLDRAINGLASGIEAKGRRLADARAELRELERQVTSVQPTVAAINGLLASFGFTNFVLRTAGDRDHLYEVVRGDGQSATTTLSEGERSFVSFLYFYHLIRGGVSEADVTSDRIVVFDDPVSSLDSDVLFIVSALIKRVLREAEGGTGQVKQVFLLTHNIYFHKEVSYDPRRGTEARATETFWIVRKHGDASIIIGYPTNPIKTSYELLWAEVRNPNRSTATIQNTLRRIVENYFKILGNVDTDQIVARFEGRDQQVCASLFSWVNDGSHGVHDDLYVSADETVVERYLDVFRRIFIETDHVAHYRMMMGSGVQAAASPAVAEAAL